VRNPVLTICQRELRSYFDSPVAYIVIFVFLIAAGFMFFSPFFLIGRADLRPFFTPNVFSPSFVLVVLVPAITMRLVAEERKSGTIELLTTLPIADWHIIVGKFLAALGLLAVTLLLTLAYAVTIAMIGDLDWGPVISGYIGMLLFVSSLAAIGVLCSTMTRNQIVAFIVGFIVCATLFFVNWLQFFMPQSLVSVVEYLSVTFHLENLARGVIDPRSVLYYLTLTGGSLFLAVQSLRRQHA
jgi:ABC-2 type transport system permease protein